MLFYPILFYSILYLPLCTLTIKHGKAYITSLRSPDMSVLCKSTPSSIHETFPYAKKVFRVNSEIMNSDSTSGTRNHHGWFITAILPSYLENSLVWWRSDFPGQFYTCVTSYVTHKVTRWLKTWQERYAIERKLKLRKKVKFCFDKCGYTNSAAWKYCLTAFRYEWPQTRDISPALEVSSIFLQHNK